MQNILLVVVVVVLVVWMIVVVGISRPAFRFVAVLEWFVDIVVEHRLSWFLFWLVRDSRCIVLSRGRSRCWSFFFLLRLLEFC